MAEWKQTLEPYIKVQERVKTAALNPVVGEDLIVGVTFISDAGPSSPTLITSQKEFLATYASKEVTKDYLESMKDLYSGQMDSSLPGTMWANAYRLAGSTNLLCVRASKADNMYFAKPLDIDGGLNNYVLKDGELLKQVGGGFKFVIDTAGDEADHGTDGWSVNVSGVGRLGNRTTDQGAQYDYYVGTLEELVEKLNETSKFFSPDYEFFEDAKMTNKAKTPGEAKCVVFYEVYVAARFLDGVNQETGEEPDPSSQNYQVTATQNACKYIIPCEIDWTEDNIDQTAWKHLNSISDSEESKYFALNVYNSSSPLKVRIRRFNHDAVTAKSLSDEQLADLTATGSSPYTVLSSVLDVLTKKGTLQDSDLSSSVLERDFFEIAVLDPSINSGASFFNIGTVYGRGDMEVSELNELLNMISLELPDDLHDLGLNYYGYNNDDKVWVKLSEIPTGQAFTTVGDLDTLINDYTESANVGDVYKVGSGDDVEYYEYRVNGRLDSTGESQIFVDLTIDPKKTKILTISDGDLKRGIDKIVEDEVYIVEGVSDLGNTEPSFQSYLANIAMSEEGNYFYPISTVNSTNYMTIGNSANRLTSLDSYKLYMSAPWDIDTGTLGTKYFASPSVIYWEGVSQNYRDGRPYASLFGQTYGRVGYQRPMTEFNKKQRQLLLSKKVNTAMWNVNSQLWQMNDNYTMQKENTIMNDEGNVRMGIHIAKVQPILLSQFIGKKITEKLCADVVSVEEFFLNTNIMNLAGNAPEAFQVFCDYDVALARQNKIKVVINIRYARSLKFVNVVNQYFDTGMDISSPL